MIRRYLLAMVAVVCLHACSASSPAPPLQVCGGEVRFARELALIGTTREDGVTLYYLAPIGSPTEPTELASVFTVGGGALLDESFRDVGPETSTLGRISGPDKGCSAVATLQVGSAASQVLLDVPGAPSVPWVLALSVGPNP